MTIQEASIKYKIPLEILQEYENWGLFRADQNEMEARQYNDFDLERLSLILTLHDAGFDSAEIESYMRLSLAGMQTEPLRMRMLEQKRCSMLDEIHAREEQLNRLDYLRHKIRKECEKRQSNERSQPYESFGD